MTSKTNWADPREFAATLADEENLVFLYSGTDAGRKSFLAWGLEEEFTSTESLKSKDKLFGYLSYALRCDFENLKRDSDSYIKLPDVYFAKFKNIVEFDHENKTIISNECEISQEISRYARNDVAIENINSNMSDQEYLTNAAHIIERIRAGDIYQANLTRKYYGEFSDEPNPFDIFHRLTQISPAPYSAFIKFHGKAIISASPEKFLTIADGKVTTCPIKGTMPLSNTAEDLANSEKDKAENLMIVDLMRNDLSRTCKNVKVDELFKIVTHKKYHHMHSTITADVQTTPLDVTLGCFPPGSMTGAPKIEAMKICSDLEQIERGVYSGALGWIADDACDLSVVIRTIIIEGKKFEFQAGGAIVADSTPERELAEIHTKIAAIKEVLNVKD